MDARKMIKMLWAPDSATFNVKRVPTQAILRIIDHFAKNAKVINICGVDFTAAPLSLDDLLQIAIENPYNKDDDERFEGSYFNTLDDYKAGGINPWEDVYTHKKKNIDSKFAVHYDEGDRYTLVWVACDPDIGEICGTAICKKSVKRRYGPETPKMMKLEDIETIPKETLVLVNLNRTAHAPPSMERMKAFQERLFMTIDVESRLDDHFLGRSDLEYE